MHGTIDASSERGRGSTFTVTLPAAELLATGRAAAPTRRPGSIDDSDAGTDVVLYAEDNLASLGVIERVFARRPETLEVAIQGKMVLDLAKVVQPVLVVLDLHLPGPERRGRPAGAEGRPGDRGDPRRHPVRRRRPRAIGAGCSTAGALAYLTKPLNVPEFLALLDRVADG